MRITVPVSKVLSVTIGLVIMLAGVLPAITFIRGPGTGPLSVAAVGQDEPGNENNTTPPDPMLEVGSLVSIETNWGNIVLGMYNQGAPITVNNFLNLTRSGFYNGIKFHRIVDGFVIQTGDPNTKDNNPYNDGMGGSPETIPLEVSTNLTHIDGAVGMARSSDPDSASSQFYICDGAQHGLDGNYAVFAVVVEGMDTVRKISGAPVWGMKRPALKEHPIDDIIMTSVNMVPTIPEPEDHGNEDQYFLGGGGNAGMGILFWLGIGAICIVIAVLVVRKVLRKRGAMKVEQDQDVVEAEVIDDQWRGYEGPADDGGRSDEEWEG